MDTKKAIEYKIKFIINYLHSGMSRFEISKDWFYVSEPSSKKDTFGNQSFCLVDLYEKYKNDIEYELKKANISVKSDKKYFVFYKVQ